MAIFGCSVLGVNTLKCVSLNKQECKIRSEIMLTVKNLYFVPAILKQINAKAVVIVLMIDVQNHVFLMLPKA